MFVCGFEFIICETHLELFLTPNQHPEDGVFEFLLVPRIRPFVGDVSNLLEGRNNVR